MRMVFFSLALRQTEGLIASVVALLGRDLSVPDYSTMPPKQNPACPATVPVRDWAGASPG
jgi:hypothetical protein